MKAGSSGGAPMASFKMLAADIRSADAMYGDREGGLVSITEQVAAIVNILRQQDKLRPVPAERLFREAAIEPRFIGDIEMSLDANPKVERVGDAYKYKPKYNLESESDVIKFVEFDHEPGLLAVEVAESYPSLSSDLQGMLHDAKLIAVQGAANATSTLYPRKQAVKLPLSGTISVKKGSTEVVTTCDLRNELFRGDCIEIKGQQYRVSTAPATGGKLWKYLAAGKSRTVEELVPPSSANRFGAKYSAAFSAPHSARRTADGYVQEFSATILPLCRPYEGRTESGVTVHKFGATAELRELWTSTAAEVPKSHRDLRTRLSKEARIPSKIVAGTLDPATVMGTEQAKTKKQRKRSRRTTTAAAETMEGYAPEVREALLAQKKKMFQ